MESNGDANISYTKHGHQGICYQLAPSPSPGQRPSTPTKKLINGNLFAVPSPLLGLIIKGRDNQPSGANAMSGQGKQAKTITKTQEKLILKHLESSRYPERDKVAFLLSVKAGLRVGEIAALTWSSVTDGEGNITDEINITNQISKGKRSGRSVPMNKELQRALIALQANRGSFATPESKIIYSERGGGFSANSLAQWFSRKYRKIGFEGVSSHSGRRTLITRAAQKISTVGGSLRDIQFLAGHSSLVTTQRYVEANEAAKRRIVQLV